MNNRVALVFRMLMLTSLSASALSQPMEGASVLGAGVNPLEIKLDSKIHKSEAARIELSDIVLVESKGDHVPAIGVSRASEVAGISAELRTFQWSQTAQGAEANLVISSPKAAALRVLIAFPEGIPADLQVAVANDTDDFGYAFPLDHLHSMLEDARQLWTPITRGESQRIRLRYRDGLSRETKVRVVDVSHFTLDPWVSQDTQLKLLACHQNYSCVTDPTLQLAGRAVAKLIITTNAGQSFLCSGALLNDRSSSGTPWFATADHCGVAASIAANVQFIWSYEAGCPGGGPLPSTTTIGAQLLFTDRQTDFSLLRITGPLPSGLRLLGWNPNPVPNATAVAGIHHPGGSFKAVSGGTKTGDETVTFRGGSNTWTIPAQLINWSFGVTEQGSSGSPLITSDGSYRGALSAGPINPSCTTATSAVYSKFSLIYPKIRAWLDPIQVIADDWPDSAASANASQEGFSTISHNGSLNSGLDQDWFKFSIPQQGVILIFTSNAENARTDTYGRIFAANGTTLLAENDDDPTGELGQNFLFFSRVAVGSYFLQVTGFQGSTGPYVLNSLYASDDDHSDFPFLGTQLVVSSAPLPGAISKAGDADSFIIEVPTSGNLTIASNGVTDVVGFLYDANFNLVADNDDASYPDNLNFSITRPITRGRYYLVVIGYDVTTRGGYTVAAQMNTPVSVNLTGLWWNPRESGWGINLNHQSDIVFATLFTYDVNGQPIWLVASDMRRQPDGSFLGSLFRASGSSYFAQVWGAASLSQVGTMRVQPSGQSAILQYAIDGVPVTKNIERQIFANPAPTCTAGGISRSSATNYQDLWWNSSEPGWGVNFAHQGNTLFATLFVYGALGQNRWFVASAMNRQSDGSFIGDLFTVTGPSFNASPWGSVGVRPVGKMSVRFTNGEVGVLTYSVEGVAVTKSISRQVFAASPPTCR